MFALYSKVVVHHVHVLYMCVYVHVHVLYPHVHAHLHVSGLLTKLPMLARADLARSSLVFFEQEMNQRVMCEQNSIDIPTI